jgi:hypothetical protein
MKRILGNVAVAAMSLTLALVAGEFLVRVLLADQNVLYPRYHTDYQYGKYTLRAARPNAEFWYTSVDGKWRFRTNSRGMRNERDFPYEKPAGAFRVLNLGDSHTFGTEARQGFTFAAVTERMLAGRKLRAEGLNAGVSGFSTAEALAFLENEGVRYRPDVVVLGFYANDFEDNLKAGLFALEDGRLAEKKHEHIPGVKIQNLIYRFAAVRWLSENSYFYSLVFNIVWEHFKVLASRHARASLPTEYAVAKGDGPTQPEIDLATALVLRMQAFCRERGIRFIVVDIPQRPAALLTASSFPPAMAARLEAAGVELIASGPLLGPYQGGAEMHVPNGQQHISEFTHTLIAAEIARLVLGDPEPAKPRGAEVALN